VTAQHGLAPFQASIPPVSRVAGLTTIASGPPIGHDEHVISVFVPVGIMSGLPLPMLA
jgi:hypothetical protein